MTPAQVCQTLKLTPNQIHKLVESGRLEVARYVSYRHGSMEVFSPEQVQQLVPAMPRIRRGWDLQQASALGARKAALIREKQRQKTQSLKKRKARFLESLDGLSERESDALRVCFFMYHLNHYAKHGHPYLYDYKEKVLRLLWLEWKPVLTEPSALLEVTFVPGAPRIRLCLDCRIKAQQQKQTHLDFLKQQEHPCPQCRKEEDYYGLYEFTLDFGEYHFCFHIPFSIARKWFTGVSINEKVISVKREGFFVFGRPIREDESLAVTLSEVVDEMETFLIRQ